MVAILKPWENEDILEYGEVAKTARLTGKVAGIVENMCK